MNGQEKILGSVGCRTHTETEEKGEKEGVTRDQPLQPDCNTLWPHAAGCHREETECNLWL